MELMHLNESVHEKAELCEVGGLYRSRLDTVNRMKKSQLFPRTRA